MTRKARLCKASASSDISEDEFVAEFLSWAAKNGVSGIGKEDSTAAVFLRDSWRGILARRTVLEGEIIVKVPLKLSLTDHDEDAISNEYMYSGAPWSVRLACHLLRQRALGNGSPWAPYINVLPRHVPTPVNWSWDLINTVTYRPAANHLNETSWIVENAATQLKRGAIGADPPHEPLSEEQANDFRWAASLVHSRTFGTAAKEGGVGVHLLLPVVDMFNHAGQQVASRYGTDAKDMHNARWDVVRASKGAEDNWEMQVTATRTIEEGEEICFSYGERSNDDMFVHYGFVPLRNPHDDVQLFLDFEDALDWYYVSGLPITCTDKADLGKLTDELRRIAQRSREAMTQRLAEAGISIQPPADRPAEAGVDLGSLDPTRLVALPGCCVTPELVSAFTKIAGGDSATAEQAIARRCWELLLELKGAVLRDLALIARHSLATGDDELPYWQYMLTYYFRSIREFTATHDLESAEAPIMADFESNPTTLLELAQQCLEVRDTESYEDGVLPYHTLLVQTLLVYKRLILWDILLSVSSLPKSTFQGMTKHEAVPA